MRRTRTPSPFAARGVHRPVAALVLGAALVTVGCTRSSSGGSPPVESEPTHGTTATGGAEFGLPKDPDATIKAAGLPNISDEARSKEPLPVIGRAHLDVSVNGQPVTVPAQVGFTKTGHSPLYTTDTSGVIQIETEQPEKPETFTIGQFFTQWGVKLDKNCLATYCTDDRTQMLGFLDGQLVPDPSSIPLKDKAQIEIWYGPKTTNPKPPASYAFPPKRP